MRILLANKWYSNRGGDCVYTLNLEALLKENGHEVAIFAMQHPNNNSSEWESYFPSEISYSPKKPLQFIRALMRPLYSFEVASKFIKLLSDFKPEVVHLNNVHSQLSPLIARIAHDRGIRVIWTLHDYKLLCPRYDCLRDGKPCELCYSGNKSNVIKYSCLKSSRLASAIAWLEAKIWNRERLESYVDAFICPSNFMKKKMEQGGFNPSKLHVIHNFIDIKKVEGPLPRKLNHYCYVGRLSEEKGIRTLLKVASKLPYTLKILGGGPLEQQLKSQYASSTNIEFLGHRNWDDCKQVIASAKFCVTPSECYENNPLSVIESLCLDTPVIASNIGGIPELIEKDQGDSCVYEAWNADALRSAIVQLWENADVRVSAVSIDRYQFSDAKYMANYQLLVNLQTSL